MIAAELRARIRAREAAIGVVGLGYVGTTSAAVIAAAGLDVTGVDIREDRVVLINRGRLPFEGVEPGLGELVWELVAAGRLKATLDHVQLSTCDAILICVETPVGSDHVPRYEALISACAALGKVLKLGALVIVESTIGPGTIDHVVRPVLEETTGGLEGTRFHLGHCPERVMPGKLLSNVTSMDRVMGACSAGAAAGMRALYEIYVKAQLDDADPLTAELVKTAENAYRDVGIAFANQLALVCDRSGGDVWRVRELVNRSPGRNVLLPGSGVGGHCLPKDTWLLSSALGEESQGSLLASARRVNDSMPAHCADLVVSLLRGHGVDVAGAHVTVLGYSYLAESGDTRNSPSASLVPLLELMGCVVTIHDPFVLDYGGEIVDAVRDADCAIVMLGHTAYRQLDLVVLAGAMRRPLLVDTRAVFDPVAMESAGFDYRRLGDGSSRRGRHPND